MFPEGRALEFLICAVVALVVVGPKDLPVLLRKLGQFTAKMRGMANEFRASFDEMARQSELDELRKEVEAMRKSQLADIAAQAADVPIQDAWDEIRDGMSPEPFTPVSYPDPAPAPKRRAPAKPKTAAAKAPAKKPAAKRVAKTKIVE